MSSRPSKTFLFVNKNEESSHLSKSAALEKSAIQRHVQTGLKRGRKPKSSTRNGSADSDATTKPFTDVRRPADISKTSDALTGSLPSRQKTASHGSGQIDLRNHHKAKARIDEQAYLVPIPQGVLNKRDPFDACSVALDSRVTGLMHYYMFYYHPSQWPNEMVLLQKGVYTFQETILGIMRNAVADRLAMNCLLAAAACRLQFVDRLPCSQVSGTEIMYMHQALKLMTSYIATADLSHHDQLRHCLISIGFLGSAEAYRGNTSGCKMHFDAQIRMLNAAGGISFLKDEYVRKHLAMADLFLACVYLKPCVFQPWYDPGPAHLLCLSPDELDQSITMPTATALLEESLKFVSVELKQLILELVESYMVRSRSVTSSMSPPRAMQVTHWITVRNMAVRNRLLSLNVVDDREHCLRMAMIMWSLLAMNVTGRAKTVKMMADKLRGGLSQIPAAAWTISEHVKLWILLVALYCVTEEGETYDWLMLETRSLNYLDLLSIFADATNDVATEALKQFQQGFFFDPKTQGPRTRVLSGKLQHKVV